MFPTFLGGIGGGFGGFATFIFLGNTGQLRAFSHPDAMFYYCIAWGVIVGCLIGLGYRLDHPYVAPPSRWENPPRDKEG